VRGIQTYLPKYAIKFKALIDFSLTKFKFYPMGQPWPTRGLLESLKYRFFEGKSTKFLEKVHIMTLNMIVFQNLDLRADLGWPWLP
jgi:hypothetical protein